MKEKRASNARRMLSVMLVVGLLLSVFCYPDAYAAETQTSGNEIKIYNTEEFCAFVKDINENKNDYKGKTVLISQDIEFSQNQANNIRVPSDAKLYFEGTLDGLGHTISGIDISGVERAYLFNLGDAGVIKNLKIKSGTFKGTSMSAGLIGINSGLITNCYVTDSTIQADWNAGGIVCQNQGRIINSCSLDNSITANGVIIENETKEFVGAGGITCKNDGSIINCCNTSQIEVKKKQDTKGVNKLKYMRGGGIAAYIEEQKAEVYLVYNCGQIVGDETDSSVSVKLGGIIGYINNGSCSFYHDNKDKRGCKDRLHKGKSASVKSGQSLSDEEMKSEGFLNTLNEEVNKNSACSPWEMDGVHTYPVIKMMETSSSVAVPTGLGTEGEILLKYTHGMTFLGATKEVYHRSWICKDNYNVVFQIIDKSIPEAPLAYRIEDFDLDGIDEMLVVGLDASRKVKLTMYEVQSGAVIEKATITPTDPKETTVDYYNCFTAGLRETAGNASCFVYMQGGKKLIGMDEFCEAFYDGDDIGWDFYTVSYNGEQFVPEGDFIEYGTGIDTYYNYLEIAKKFYQTGVSSDPNELLSWNYSVRDAFPHRVEFFASKVDVIKDDYLNMKNGEERVFNNITFTMSNSIRTDSDDLTENPSVSDKYLSAPKPVIKSVKRISKNKVKVKWGCKYGPDSYTLVVNGKKYKQSMFTFEKTIRVKRGKTYHFKIRAQNEFEGKQYIGAWSKSKKIRIKKGKRRKKH